MPLVLVLELAASLTKAMEARFDKEVRPMLDQLQAVKDTVQANAEASTDATPATPATTRMIMTFKDESMANIYGHWTKHRTFFRANPRMPWNSCFEKKEIPSRTVRFNKYKPWLEWMDTVAEAGHEPSETLQKLCTMASALRLPEHQFVKEVFYMFTRDEDSKHASKETVCKMMAAAGLPILH